MAGNQRDFIYTADDGSLYAVRLDAGNAQLAPFGFTVYTGNPPLKRPPQGLRLRRVLLKGVDRPIVRRLPVASKLADIWTGEIRTVLLVDYTDLQDVTFTVERRLSERQYNSPTGRDTGLT